jgi:hypothetical protein
MRFKTLPIFTLATYRMGSNFSIRVTPNINLIKVGLAENNILNGMTRKKIQDRENQLLES